MPVRTRRLFGMTQTSSATGVVVFTCPADRTAILKSVAVQLVTGAAPVGRVVVRTAGQSAGMTVVQVNDPSAHVVWAHGLYVVMQPGDTVLLISLDGVAAVRAAGYGVLLAGAPA